jgi:AAA domain
MSESRKRTRRGSATAALPVPPPLVEGVEWGSATVPRPTEWYWPGAIPAGSLVLSEGRKSTGKSTVAAAIAACVTGGPAIPGWTGPRDGRVLWQGGEESWESVIIPRLVAAGADLGRVGRLQLRDQRGALRRCVLPDDLCLLGDAIREGQVRLIVLDPYISLAHPSLDMRVEQQARLYLESLSQTLADCACVGLLIRHIRKGTGGDSREAGLGSVAISNVARSLMRCDEHPHQPGDHVLSVIACNYGKKMATQIYRLRDSVGSFPKIEWVGQCDLDSDSIAEGRGSEAERDEWGEADHLLVSSIGDRWIAVAELLKEADGAGISPRMLRRAKARLRVQTRRVQHANQGWWEWGAPKNGWPSALLASDLHGGGGGARVDMERLGHVAPKKERKPRRKKQGDQDAPAHTRAPLDDPREEVENGST